MEYIHLTIEDNVIGYNIKDSLELSNEKGKFGLIGIIERIELLNGEIEFISALNKGLKINIKIIRKELSQTLSSF